MKKAEAEQDQQVALDLQREQHVAKQAKDADEQAKQMEQQSSMGGQGMQGGCVARSCVLRAYIHVRKCQSCMVSKLRILFSVLSGDTLGWCVCIGWGGWLGEVVAARGAAAAPILRSAATTVLLYYYRDSCLPLA